MCEQARRGSGTRDPLPVVLAESLCQSELICLLCFVYLLLHQAQINGNPSVTCSTTSPRTSHLENWRPHKSYNELLLNPPYPTPPGPILSLKAGTVKLGRAQVFCLKAFAPRGAPLIIFYSNVSARKVTKPEVYCPLIYPPTPCAGMKWITPFPLNSHDS